MTDHELELRLVRVARTLDADAPAVDPTVLVQAARRRLRPAIVAIAAAAALAGVSVAPAAVSALGDLFRRRLRAGARAGHRRRASVPGPPRADERGPGDCAFPGQDDPVAGDA